MWSAYSTREAAEFIGLSESAVRACARAGILSPDSSTVPMKFSFRDLKVLKIVRALSTNGLSPRRIRRQLGDLQRRLPEATSLAELSISVHGGHVVVQDSDGAQRRAWRADNGQLLLDFTDAEPELEVTPMPILRTAPAPEPVASLSADDWFERAVEIEEADPAGAIEAYKRALRLRPDCTETLINLGRLYAESGEPELAADCFKDALELDPADATAVYNLGVVAQDDGNDDEAVALYRRALKLDKTLSEAHYNLATIFDRTGDPHAAIRHINAYRKLNKDR